MKEKIKDFKNFNFGQLAVICGRTGAGKSGFISAYSNLKARWQIRHVKKFCRKQCNIDEQITAELNEGGYTNLKTLYPNIYADFMCGYKYHGKIYQYPDFNLLRFWLPNPWFETDFYQPGADLICDEAHQKLNNQNYYQIKQPFYDALSTDRHVGYNLILLTQIFSKLPSDIRRLTTDIYYITDLKVICFPFTKIPFKSKWKIIHFYGQEFTNFNPFYVTKKGYSNALKQAQVLPEIEFLTFSCYGNWHKLYDTREQRYKRFRGLPCDVSYTRRYAKYPDRITPESIRQYNLFRGDEVPDAFRLSEKKCVEKYGTLREFINLPYAKEQAQKQIAEMMKKSQTKLLPAPVRKKPAIINNLFNNEKY